MRGSRGEVLQKTDTLQFVGSKALNGELYQYRDYHLPTSSPPPAIYAPIREALNVLLQLCSTFSEGSTVHSTCFIRMAHVSLTSKVRFNISCRENGSRSGRRRCQKAKQFREKLEKYPDQENNNSVIAPTRERMHTPKNARRRETSAKPTKSIVLSSSLHARKIHCPNRKISTHGDLNVIRHFCPTEESIRNYWASEGGKGVLDTNNSSFSQRRVEQHNKPKAGD